MEIRHLVEQSKYLIKVDRVTIGFSSKTLQQNPARTSILIKTTRLWKRIQGNSRSHSKQTLNLLIISMTKTILIWLYSRNQLKTLLPRQCHHQFLKVRLPLPPKFNPPCQRHLQDSNGLIIFWTTNLTWDGVDLN